MAGNPTGTKKRWLASASGAAIVVAALLLLFRFPRSAPIAPPPIRAQPPITVKPGRRDELAMQDLAPLFLPTEYNATTTSFRQREPGPRFSAEDAAKWKFDETNPGLQIPVPFQAPGSPAEILADSPGPLASGMGQANVNVPPMAPHAGFLQVFAAASGQSVLTQTLAPDIQPRPGAVESQTWKPMEFLAAVDAAGLVGSLVLTTSSGVDDVDNFFRNYLARRAHLGDRLTPGFYRIVVGP